MLSKQATHLDPFQYGLAESKLAHVTQTLLESYVGFDAGHVATHCVPSQYGLPLGQAAQAEPFQFGLALLT